MYVLHHQASTVGQSNVGQVTLAKQSPNAIFARENQKRRIVTVVGAIRRSHRKKRRFAMKPNGKR